MIIFSNIPPGTEMAWTKHGSRIAYEKDWMTVRQDHVTNPGGGQNLYGHVQFKNLAVARDLTEGLARLEEAEDITVRTVAVDEAIQMVMDGDITDALTVAALLRFNCGYGAETL